MKTRREFVQRVVGQSVFASAAMMVGLPAWAQHRRRSCNRGRLDARYGYADDVEKQRGVMIAIADPARDIVPQNGRIPSPQEAESNVRRPRSGKKKPFHFRGSAIEVGPFRLESLGMTLYELEPLVASGVLTHNGGSDNHLLSGHAVIRLRMIASLNQQPEILIDSVTAWHSEKHFRIRRSDRKTIDLACRSIDSSGLFRHFDEITHAEVELEYRKDR